MKSARQHQHRAPRRGGLLGTHGRPVGPAHRALDVVGHALGRAAYIDVWETEEQCARAFEERVHPAVDTAFGGRRPPEPVLTRLDVVEVRGRAVGVRA